MNIEDSDLEPLHGHLKDMSLTSKLDLALTGEENDWKISPLCVIGHMIETWVVLNSLDKEFFK